MTSEEFNKRMWTVKMKAKYKGKVYNVLSVDFDEQLVAIDELGPDEEMCWKRCESVEIV